MLRQSRPGRVKQRFWRFFVHILTSCIRAQTKQSLGTNTDDVTYHGTFPTAATFHETSCLPAHRKRFCRGERSCPPNYYDRPVAGCSDLRSLGFLEKKIYKQTNTNIVTQKHTPTIRKAKHETVTEVSRCVPFAHFCVNVEYVDYCCSNFYS